MHEREWPIGSPEAAFQALHLSGHRLPPGVDPAGHFLPARQLVAAILLQALADAWGGSLEASAWLDEEAPVFGQWLDLDPACLAGWRSFRPPMGEAWDPAEFADLWDPAEFAGIWNPAG